MPPLLPCITFAIKPYMHCISIVRSLYLRALLLILLILLLGLI
jgi:hypothetical protein